MEGHVRSWCPYPKQPKDGTESQERRQVRNMTSQDNQLSVLENKMKILALRELLRQDELAEVIKNSGAMNLMIPAETGSSLGPNVYVMAAVEGVGTDGLVDTGSPATIVSLEFM